MKKIIFTTSLVAGIIIGCGGGSSSSTETTSNTQSLTTNKTINGQFIDAPVMGLKYSSGNNIMGFTDENGNYECIEGDNVTFYADEIKLGTVKCSNITTPLTLANNNVTVAKNIAYFLQNLDSDQNPSNGITIPTTIPFSNIDFNDKNSIDKAFQSIYLTPKITPDEAYNNLINSLKNIGINNIPTSSINNENSINNVNQNNNLQTPITPNTQISENNYQCTTSINYEGFYIKDSVSIIKGEDILKLSKDNNYCEIEILKPINVKEIYAKVNVKNYKDLETGETGEGYVEYFYPSGKVHYNIYSSIYGNANCTAYYDVSYLNGTITSEDDLDEYTSFDDYEYLKDQGNCPNWVIEEDYEETESLISELYEIEEDIKITDKSNKNYEIKRYEKITK